MAVQQGAPAGTHRPLLASAHSETQAGAWEVLVTLIEQVRSRGQSWSWNDGIYEIPMIAASGDCSLATV